MLIVTVRLDIVRLILEEDPAEKIILQPGNPMVAFNNGFYEGYLIMKWYLFYAYDTTFHTFQCLNDKSEKAK